LSISHETVNGGAETDIRASLDDAVPVLTGDPTSTVQTFVQQSIEREMLEQLPNGELLRKAAREVLIAMPSHFEGHLTLGGHLMPQGDW
jgi:hypothetical protein